MRVRGSLLLMALGLLLAACGGVPDGATPTPPQPSRGEAVDSDLTRLYDQADAVVLARVAGISSEFEQTPEGDEMIMSQVTLEVQKKYKGSAAPSPVVRAAGGTVGSVRLVMTDQPWFSDGATALFFLQRSDGAWQVLQGIDGKLDLVGANQVRYRSHLMSLARAERLFRPRPSGSQ